MKILMIDNADSFTYNLVQILEETGNDVVTYRNDAGLQVVEKEKPQLIVISPGPSRPENAGMSMEVVSQYHKKVPMLGVCLGMEAMLAFFGTDLKELSLDEIVHGGSTPIMHDGKTIFAGLLQGFQGTRYHSLGAYADDVKNPLEVSAYTTAPNGREIAVGVRHKEHPVEGIQFHPESVLTMRGGVGEKIILSGVRYLTGNKI
ncbi:gamma-glutamyl-gamma-aminobutyrate hydrolase family protein [Candidatus Woesearchaeota archaeon]|nr:gamma-glutamyl-gamma-aminobutyrate hydrolase family protein [Candidatus Woesearchaeota archaeon]